MRTILLGNTGIEVSKICFGSLAVSGPGVSMPDKLASEIICYSLLRGINFIDTAQYYDNYEVIARGIGLYRSLVIVDLPYDPEAVSFFEALPDDLKDTVRLYHEGKKTFSDSDSPTHPDKIIICSKTYAYSRELAVEAVGEAEKRLGRHVDIFLLHEQESGETLKGHAEALDYLFECKNEGRIKAVGLSTHCVDAVYAAAEMKLDVVFAMYNHTGLGINPSEKLPLEADEAEYDIKELPGNISCREQMKSALELCHRNGIGVMLMKVFGGGNLLGTNDAENPEEYAAVALRFALDFECGDTLALGMQSFDEVDADISFCENGKFPDDFHGKIKRKKRRLKIDDYCEGCGSCVARCGQGALKIVNGQSVCDESKCVLCGYCAGVCPVFAIHQTF